MVDKPVGSKGTWLLQNNYQQQRTDGTALSTAEWMVQIGSAGAVTTTGSTLGDGVKVKFGAEGYVELLKWEGRASRDVRGLSSSQMLSSASIQHSHIEIQIPIGNYIPTLETMMYHATNVDSIKLVRLGSVNGADKQMVALQTITFANCQIVFFEQSGDVLIISFRFESKTNAVTSYDQKGAAIGSEVSHSVDFTTGVAGAAAAGGGGGGGGAAKAAKG